VINVGKVVTINEEKSFAV